MNINIWVSTLLNFKLSRFILSPESIFKMIHQFAIWLHLIAHSLLLIELKYEILFSVRILYCILINHRKEEILLLEAFFMHLALKVYLINYCRLLNQAYVAVAFSVFIVLILRFFNLMQILLHETWGLWLVALSNISNFYFLFFRWKIFVTNTYWLILHLIQSNVFFKWLFYLARFQRIFIYLWIFYGDYLLFLLN